MGECMKVSGIKIRDMEEDLRNTQMAISMLENLKKEKLMEMGNMNGFRKGKFMMGNGPKVQDMAMEFGKERMEIVILANGKGERLMAMGCINGVMEINTKVNGENV
jgi:hypothetical protein